MKEPRPTFPTVKHRLWQINGESTEVIVMHSGDYFIAVKYEHARGFVDRVHDLCDDYERQQRERKQPH